jgi:hypothetical protein
MELGGAVLTANMRYFRNNLPTLTASLADLEHLTLDQVLADVAVFIHTARDHLSNENGKVFVFGTGIGGTLAVLARQKYPNLIYAGWSSNGLFLPTVFTTEVYNTVADNIREVGSYDCGDRVTEAFRQIDQLIAAGDDATLVEEFGICRPFNISSRMDIAMFSEGVVEQISAQFERFHHTGLTSFCESMAVIPTDPMRSLSRWIRFNYNVDVGTCQNYDYEGRIQLTSDTEWENPGTASGLRQFLYLQCTQFGNLRTNTNGGMFGNRITEEYRQRMCMDSFGEEYNFDELYKTVELLNVAHGGQNPRVTRVHYTNGYLDQWLSAGITYTYDEDAHVVNVPGYSRWADLTSTNTLDSIVLYNAKTSVVNAFRRWNAE